MNQLGNVYICSLVQKDWHPDRLRLVLRIWKSCKKPKGPSCCTNALSSRMHANASVLYTRATEWVKETFTFCLGGLHLSHSQGLLLMEGLWGRTGQCVGAASVSQSEKKNSYAKEHPNMQRLTRHTNVFTVRVGRRVGCIAFIRVLWVSVVSDWPVFIFCFCAGHSFSRPVDK